MKLWKRIKYRLFVWLMDDICKMSECETCQFNQYPDNNYDLELGSVDGKLYDRACRQYYAHAQAYRVYRAESESEARDE